MARGGGCLISLQCILNGLYCRLSLWSQTGHEKLLVGWSRARKNIADRIFSKVLRGGLLRFKADSLYWATSPIGFIAEAAL